MGKSIFKKIKSLIFLIGILVLTRCSTNIKEDVEVLGAEPCSQCTQECKEPFIRHWNLETTTWSCPSGTPLVDPKFCFWITHGGGHCSMIMHRFFCCDDHDFNYELTLTSCNAFDINGHIRNCNSSSSGQNWDFSGNGTLNNQGDTDPTNDILHINFDLTYSGGGTTYACGADFTPVDECTCN